MKIPTPDEQRRTYTAQLQPHVTEPILAIGFVTSAGYVAGLTKDYATGRAVGMFSFAMGRGLGKRKTERRIEASQNHVIAVTATSVHLFPFPMRGEPFVVSGPPTTWARAEIRVTAEAKRKYAQPIHVAFADDHTEDYDISIIPGDHATFNDPMLDLLLNPVAV